MTVKHLRDERYHERFPIASDAKSPLKPSNTKRLPVSPAVDNSYINEATDHRRPIHRSTETTPRTMTTRQRSSARFATKS